MNQEMVLLLGGRLRNGRILLQRQRRPKKLCGLRRSPTRLNPEPLPTEPRIIHRPPHPIALILLCISRLRRKILAVTRQRSLRSRTTLRPDRLRGEYPGDTEEQQLTAACY